MRMPRFRFTVRRMMVVVAIAGVMFGLSLWSREMLRTRHRHRERAAYHRRALTSLSGIKASAMRSTRTPAERSTWLTDFEVKNRLWLPHHFRIQAKYERLARYPWLPVAPDPPEPK